jgi:TPR repeat protein
MTTDPVKFKEALKLYEEGQKKQKGLIKDHKKAFYFFLKSAEMGYEKAQLRAGICYRDGLGVAKSKDEAVSWLNKAAAQGSDEAKMALVDLK